MRKLLITIIALLSFCHIQAAGTDAFYVWVDGSSTCYRLESSPRLTFSGGKALLAVNGETVLTLDCAKASDFKMAFGTYQEATAIKAVETDDATEGVSSKVRRCGKYITGGRVIIIKDGRKYNLNGTEIK